MWTLEPGKVSWALNPALHLPYHVYLNFVDYLRTYNIKLGIKEGGLRNTTVLYLNLGISYITVCYFSSLYNTHKFFQRRQWHTTPVLLPGKSHGPRSLVCCSPWGREELDTTERLHFPFTLLCIGEGNGNPLQCSCLENLRDRGAWWAAVYGVAPSRTPLKQLSSSNSSSISS